MTSNYQDNRNSTGTERFIGLDVGAETIKAVELTRRGTGWEWTRRERREHRKEPARMLKELLGGWNWSGIAGAAASGRFSPQLAVAAIPVKQALSRGVQFLHGESPVTVISIGSHGFSVLERRAGGLEVLRGNSRCSQGTGNFLRQLVERFGLTVEEASRLGEAVASPAPLSGRCPVILKTDMTHLANKGEDRARILAGLFDAVCENVITLVKPGLSPERVILTGGVSLSRRVRSSLGALLAKSGLHLESTDEEDSLFLEALGCALLAAENPATLPALDRLVTPPKPHPLEMLPPLSDSLKLVRRMTSKPPAAPPLAAARVALGFDIGSTGSKAVALDLDTATVLWEGYRRTSGAPVEAAQALLLDFTTSPAGHLPLHGCGVTGSGREIVGSLLSTCYAREAVFILNEIAAHAAGALHHDPSVDTIFEIGGQDAKYIRLSGGRIVDCAMNEACSAGTGSFIEEQGRRFSGMQDLAVLNRRALEAARGISLGQHCSVFMAEIIEDAAAAGIEQGAIMAGLYDAVVQNYLHRVKGNRSVGQVIFCQGMPFAADALAAAVARRTGSRVIIPPNPGTIGALGIALLTRAEVAAATLAPLDPARFLEATIEQKSTFVCGSTQGCGGAGNHCRVDCIKTRVAGQPRSFTWGGGCSLYDKGTRTRKLPDLAPDPFKEREALLAAILTACTAGTPGRKRVALTDEFALNGLLPFFATYLHELGFAPCVTRNGDHSDLRQGIREASVPFCAPMQLYHGMVYRMILEKPDYLFMPMVRDLPHEQNESGSVTCPLVQASPDILKAALKGHGEITVLSPVINFGAGALDSQAFRDSAESIARELGITGSTWRRAFTLAKSAQQAFTAASEAIGRRALDFCRTTRAMPVVVLGRSYTLHSRVLNSNVPAILREQGAMAIPVDCYPVAPETPVFPDMYWGYGQRLLRAAHQIRRSQGVYSLYCSNYSCGPDSFALHFYSYIMKGRPFAVIETDGHSGDAGTKTRVEAFLHCVEQDAKAPAAVPCHDFREVTAEAVGLEELRRAGTRLLIPSMGPSAAVLGACFRGIGVETEVLRPPDRQTLQLGRRHTSGKECVPVCITLGSLLERLGTKPDATHRYVFLMPKSDGPCRLGVYHLLQRMVLEQQGWRGRVRIWSPCSTDYFAGTPPGFPALVMAGLVGMDMLEQALHDVRPVERQAGRAESVVARYKSELLARVEQQARQGVGGATALGELMSGRSFGLRDLLARAAAELAGLRSDKRCPTVLLTGEIYVRCEPFANGFAAEKLEARGLRVRLTPPTEWLDYVRALRDRHDRSLGRGVASLLQRRLHRGLYRAMGDPLGWAPWVRAEATLQHAAPHLSSALEGEAVLTVGGAVVEAAEGHVDGVLSVGPLECMPNKIAEAQMSAVAESSHMPILTLALNGDPVESEVLDNFVFEVKARAANRQGARAHAGAARQRERSAWFQHGAEADYPLPVPSEAMHI